VEIHFVWRMALALPWCKCSSVQNAVHGSDYFKLKLEKCLDSFSIFLFELPFFTGTPKIIHTLYKTFTPKLAVSVKNI